MCQTNVKHYHEHTWMFFFQQDPLPKDTHHLLVESVGCRL